MAVKSRQEIDFKRLLSRCEAMAGDRDRNDWRLKAFVRSLEEKLTEMQSLNVFQLDANDCLNYGKKVEFLKGLLEVDSLQSSSHRLIATEILSPLSSRQSNGAKMDRTKEIHLNSQARYGADIRSELFQYNSSPVSADSQLRKRTPNENSTSNDFDAVIKYHDLIQERVAEDMLELTKNLKENCTLSNEIIKKDTEVIERSSQLAENNVNNLKQNTTKIGDFVRRSCQYWLWIMIAVVFFTFMWMVVFIRMFPKRHA